MTDAMRTYWNERSLRERWLLGTMLAIAGAMLLWFGIVQPLQAARVRGEARLASATEEAGLINARVTAVRRAGGRPVVALSGPLADSLRAAAEGAGLPLAKADPVGDNAAAIGIASVKGPALFSYLAALEARGLVAESLSIRPNSDGTLSAEATIRTRGR